MGGDGDCMGWLEVWVKVVDGVGNGISVGSTYIGEGGCTTSIGADGAGAGASADVGTGAIGGGTGGGSEKKNKGPGS
jgi:hypothetical protein